jgi:hypothetical protein
VHLLEKLSSVNERLEEILSRLAIVENKLDTFSVEISSSQSNHGVQKNTIRRGVSQQNISSQLASGNGSYLDLADPLLYEQVYHACISAYTVVLDLVMA